MARRRVFWHIGPDDLGTAWIATALDAARDDLATAGVLVPGDPQQWERATAEVLRTHRALGLDRDAVEGQVDGLCRRMWKHKGVSLLSTPGLAAAGRDEVMFALDGIRGAEIHLVVVERPLADQVAAGAQDALEHGATTRPTTYAGRVLDPAQRHEQAVGFRAGHDLPGLLKRWSRTVLAEHVHVIAESTPELVWKRIGQLVGADLPLPEPVSTIGEGLGATQLQVLREVSVALDGRLDPAGRRRVLRDWLSREVLAGQTPSGPTVLEPATAALLGPLAEEWTTHVQKEGFDMQGTITATAPDAGTDSTTGPLALSPDQSATAALADATVEVARLRAELDDLAAQNQRLDAKRRKHKKRLRSLQDDLAQRS